VRLIKAKVNGYKRLAKDCELNLDADPLCIVGPNAAGKSSFLDALVHLNHSDPFEQTEKTRVPGGQTLEPRIEARFVLDEHERDLMKEFPETSEVRQFFVIKMGGQSGLRYTADPYPRRDLTKRGELRELLEQLAETGWIEQTQKVEETLEAPPDPLIGALFSAALEVASSSEEKLEERAGEFDALDQRIGPILGQIGEREKPEEEGIPPYSGPDWPGFPEELIGLQAELTALAALEREEHPLQKVVRAFSDQVPKFLKFDDQARKLETKYDLSGEEPEDDLGIHNFLALAGTSWSQAVEVVERDDPGWTKTYIEDRDSDLKEQAALKWGQSEIEVTIGLNASVLSILLSMQAHDFIGFDDHSDGLKSFMALRAFVFQKDVQDGIKPIVLIDEADLHLHYDAQADLVGVFEEQEEAAQIIYTTHSAGCLPRDLGCGVRAIVPETEERDGKTVQKDHSEAVNRFWTKGRGFSPLLLAMGAGAFAFSATQYAVITEGMSDALLLPTLIREATGEKRLRYQPVPSFAEATDDDIQRFDLIAGRIAFLADGDEGGRNHVKKLLDNGISPDQILYLGDDPESELAIEDLLAKSVYLTAVNQELHTWHGLEYPADQLPDKGRSKAVKDWCAQQTGRDGKPIKVSKVDVAQRVLDQRSPEIKLLAKAPTVKKIHEKVLSVFESAPERMKQLRQRATEAAPPETE
jgi:AAA domain, putative AbiEii toxin, Type IV TA system/AAA ATPase domain